MAQTINADDGVISGSTGLKFTADTTGILALQTNGTTAVTVNASGSVGVGTTSPGAYKLNVNYDSNGNQAIVQGSANNIDLAIQNNQTASYNWRFLVGGTSGLFATNKFALMDNTNTARLVVDTSGNVGIGTSSPGSYGLLTVLSTTAGSAKINIMDNSAGAAAPLLQFGMNHSNGFNTSDAARVWTTATASNIASLNFAAYNTAAPSTAQMVLNAGNLVLGNTTTDPQVRMVVQNSGAQNVAWFKNYSGTRASPTENADWPWPVLALTAYGNYYAQRMLSFTLPNDANSQTNGIYHTDNSVWHFSLNGVTGANSWDNASAGTTPASASSSDVGLELNGPGNLRIGTTGAKSIFFRTGGTDRVIINSTGLIYYSTSTAVTAAGTTQGTATALTSDINHVTTVGAGTGVILPTPAQAGLKILVRNGGANALALYPHSGGNIAGTGVNAAISVDTTVVLELIAFDTTNWYIPSAVLS